MNIESIYMAVGVVYRLQSMNYLNFIDNFETTVSIIIPLVDDILCLGDFNIDLLDYNNKRAGAVYNMLDGLCLKQIVSLPTRLTDKSATLIDYILFSKEDLITEVGVKHMPEVSDDELILVTLKYKLKVSPVKFINIRNFKNLNYNQFDADLRSITWDIIYELDNIDSKIKFLNDNIITLLDIHVPMRTYKVTKPYAP